MDEPTKRRAEPEIIPPGQPLPYADAGAGSVNRVYVKQIQAGPLGVILIALGVTAAVVFGFFFLIGTAILGLAAIGALVIAGIVMGALRGPPRSPR